MSFSLTKDIFMDLFNPQEDWVLDDQEELNSIFCSLENEFQTYLQEDGVEQVSLLFLNFIYYFFFSVSISKSISKFFWICFPETYPVGHSYLLNVLSFVQKWSVLALHLVKFRNSNDKERRISSYTYS